MPYKVIIKTGFKATALAVVLCMLAGDAAMAAPIAMAPLRPQMPLQLALSSEIGWTEDFYRASGDAPLIVLVQDAHTNASAQFNSARVIDRALQAAHTDLVLMEAGQGDLNLNEFRTMGTPAHRRAASASFVRKGRLQGPEYLQLTSKKNIQLWGVENRAAYERALCIYREVVRRRPATSTAIARMEQTLSALGPDAFGPTLADAWKYRSAYRGGSIGSVEYAEYLLRSLGSAGADNFSYPNLKTLSKLKMIESKIDFDLASRAIRKILAAMDGDSDVEAVAKIVSGAKDADADAAAQRAGRQLAQHKNILTPEEFSEARKYLVYRSQSRRLNVRGLIAETADAEKNAFDRITAGDPAAERWVDAARGIELIRKLTDLQSDSASLVGTLGRKPEEYVRRIQGELNRRIFDIGRQEENVLFDDTALAQTVRLAADFYRLAGIRDHFFVSQTLRQMRVRSAKAAVLVAGGYHADHLKRLLRERGISYVSVIPRVEAETDHGRYERLLISSVRGKDLSPIKRTGSAIALYPAGTSSDFSSGTRDLLRTALTSASSAAGARMADQRSIKPNQPDPRFTPTAIEARLRLEAARVLYRLRLMSAGKLALIMNRYHRALGFQPSMEPDVRATMKPLGPYWVGATINEGKKVGGVDVRENLRERSWIERTTGVPTDPKCRLCPTLRGLGQWTVPLQGSDEWLMTSQPFPSMDDHIMLISTRHEDLAAERSHIIRLLHAARALGPEFTVIQNAEGAGASLPRHHHVQGLHQILPIMTDRFIRVRMNSDAAAVSTEAVVNYPGKPLVLRARSAERVAREADRIVRLFVAQNMPVDFSARWTRETGYELFVLPFRAGKVKDPAKTDGSLIDHGALIYRKNGLLGGSGAQQVSGMMITSHLRDKMGVIAEAGVPKSEQQIEDMISEMLVPAETLWVAAVRSGLAGPTQVQRLLGARMAVASPDERVEEYLQKMPVVMEGDGTVVERSDRLRIEWDRLKADLWTDASEEDYPAIALEYTRAATLTAKRMYELALEEASGADEALRTELGSAVLVATGSFGRNQLTRGSDMDHYWIFPPSAYQNGPLEGEADSALAPRPEFLRMIQTYRNLHNRVFESVSSTDLSARIVPTRRVGDAADTAEKLLSQAGGSAASGRDLEQLIRLTEAVDAAYIAGDRGQFNAEKTLLQKSLSVGKGAVRRINQLIRKAILVRDAEYRSEVRGNSSFGGAREWSRLQWLLDMEIRSSRVPQAPEWLARTLQWWTGVSGRKKKIESAVWRQLRRRDQGVTADTKDPRLAIERARDSAMLFDESVRVMQRLWSIVRDPSDPAVLQIFLASGESRSLIDETRLKEIRRRSEHEAVLEVGVTDNGGLTELLVAWPGDRPGLLADLTGVLIAHGIELAGIHVRTLRNRPFNHFWVRGWPSDPAKALALTQKITADLRALRAGALTVPGLFAREGRPHAFSRASHAGDAPPMAWGEGSEIRLLAREYQPIDDTESRQPSLFYLASRWFGANGISIVKTSSYRSQGGKVLAGWVIRDGDTGREFADSEMRTICEDLEKFLQRPEIYSWDFLLATSRVADVLNQELRALGTSDGLTDRYKDVWMEFSRGLWGVIAVTELHSRFDDMDARLRLHAQGMRSTAAAIFNRLLREDRYAALRNKIVLSETLELAQDTLLPGREASFLLIPASAGLLDDVDYLRVVADFRTEIADVFSGVFRPGIGGKTGGEWRGGARVRLVSREELEAQKPSDIPEWSDPKTLTANDGALVRLMEAVESRVLAGSAASAAADRFKGRMLKALREPDPQSWGSRVLAAAWNSNFGAIVFRNQSGGILATGFDAIHSLQFADITPLLRYGRRLRLITLGQRHAYNAESARDAEVGLLEFQHRMWLLRIAGGDFGESPSHVNFSDIYGINEAQSAGQGNVTGVSAEAMELGRRKGLRDYLLHSMRPEDRERYGIHPDQALDLASEAPIVHALYHSARTLFEASLDALNRRELAANPKPQLAARQNARLLDLGLGLIISNGYYDPEAGWVPSRREEVGFANAEDRAAAVERWSRMPEEMMKVIRIAAQQQVPVSEEVLTEMRRVRERWGLTLNSRWADPSAQEKPFADEAASEFRALLSITAQIDGAIVELYRTGLLGAILPEFGGSENLGDKLQFHLYTPSWHQIRVLKKIERPSSVYPDERADDTAVDGEMASAGPRTEALIAYRKTAADAGLLPAIRLAALLHDAPKPSWRFKRGLEHDEIVAHDLIPEAQRRIGIRLPEYAAWLAYLDLTIPKMIPKVEHLVERVADGRERIGVDFRAGIEKIWSHPDAQSGGRRIVERMTAAASRPGSKVSLAEAMAGMFLFILCDEADTSFVSIRQRAPELYAAWRLLGAEGSDMDPMAGAREEMARQAAFQLPGDYVPVSGSAEADVMDFLRSSDASLWNLEKPKIVAKQFMLHAESKRTQTVGLMVVPAFRGSNRATVTVAVPKDTPGIYASITGVLSAYADIRSSHAHAIGSGGDRVVLDRFEIVWRDATGPANAQEVLGKDLASVIAAAASPESNAFEEAVRNVFRLSGQKLPEQIPDRSGREYEFVTTETPVEVAFEALGGGRYRVEVDALDFAGLLHTVSYALWRLMGFDVESAAIATAANRSQDSFMVRTPDGKDLSRETIDLYRETLRVFLAIDRIRPLSLKKIFEVVKQVIAAREDYVASLRKNIEKGNESKAPDQRTSADAVIKGYQRVAKKAALEIKKALVGPTGLDGVVIDGPSGIGKTTFIRFLEDELRKLGLEPSVLPLDLFMWPTEVRNQVKADILEKIRTAQAEGRAFEATDEAARIWREDGDQGVRAFLKKYFSRIDQASRGKPQPSLLIPAAYVRKIGELDPSLFEEIQNYPLLAGVKERSSTDLLIPVRPGRVLLLDGKYAHRWIPSERQILTIRLDGDEARIKGQFEARTRGLKTPTGEPDTKKIDETILYQQHFLWPSWETGYKNLTDPAVHLRIDLASQNPNGWRAVLQHSLSGARLASSPTRILLSDAARFADAVAQDHPRAPLAGRPVWVMDAAARSSGGTRISVLDWGADEKPRWNGARLSLRRTHDERSEPRSALVGSTQQDLAQLRRELDQRWKAADLIPVEATTAVSPVAVHLRALSAGASAELKTARLLLLARDLSLESRSGPTLELFLDGDEDGAFAKLLQMSGFKGVIQMSPAPVEAVHLLTRSDLRQLSLSPAAQAELRVVVLENPDDGEERSAVYPFRSLIRFARILRAQDPGDLTAVYQRITGQAIAEADLARLVRGDEDAVRLWAFKPVRALLGEALSLYAIAARMSERSA